jgi:hypothetical protein
VAVGFAIAIADESPNGVLEGRFPMTSTNHIASGRAHRADKWTHFSASNDAPLKEGSIGSIPKGESPFGSDALGRIRVVMVPLPPRRLVRDLADQVHFLFDDLVREPVPGHFIEMLRRLR